MFIDEMIRERNVVSDSTGIHRESMQKDIDVCQIVQPREVSDAAAWS